MRVLAGALKGQRLTTPRGRTTRPTADRVRIACLDTLMPFLGGGPFLDLFAGAGGVGIEALSRGAPSAVFVEQDGAALRALRDNVERLALADRARVVRADAARAVALLEAGGERFGVVFLDPPYDSPRAAAALEAVGSGRVLVAGAVVVIQHGTKTPPAAASGALSLWKARRFGETTLTFFRSDAYTEQRFRAVSQTEHTGASVGKRAVYPGMFDPMHNGHLDLIERSLRIFDELIVAVVANPSKEPLFTVKERLELIDECTTGIGMGRMRITSFDGLLIDLVEREGADCIVRGLRAVSDFEYEFQMALMNRKLRHTVETVFMMPHERYTYIASRLIKEVASLGAPVTGLVPPPVEERLSQKFSKPR